MHALARQWNDHGHGCVLTILAFSIRQLTIKIEKDNMKLELISIEHDLLTPGYLIKLSATFYEEDEATRKTDYAVFTIAISETDAEGLTIRQLETEAIARAKLLVS